MRIVSLNIRLGRAGGLKAVLQALKQGNIRVIILQKMKLTHGMQTLYGVGYLLWATEGESRHHGGIAVIWQEEAGWQIKGMVNFGPNMVSFLLKSGASRWYVIGAYVPLKDVLTVHQVEQVLAVNPKWIETISMRDLKSSLEEPQDEREEDMTTSLDDHGLEDIIRHFTPRRRYIVRGRWIWNMQQEGSQVTGRENYVLSMAQGQLMT